MLTVFLILMLIFSALCLLVITSAFFGFLITRVPFVPTRAKDIEDFIGRLGISSGQVFYDLGSGDGRVALAVSRLTGAKTLGFELTWWTYAWATVKARLSGLPSSFLWQNFFSYSWQEADYVYAYLYPHLMGRVRDKFFRDCKPGSVALVRDFPFPEVAPAASWKVAGGHEFYVYRK